MNLGLSDSLGLHGNLDSGLSDYDGRRKGVERDFINRRSLSKTHRQQKSSKAIIKTEDEDEREEPPARLPCAVRGDAA